ncbi:MAG: hypothetical protein LLG24_01480 [Actinomycetia bacterium]|nr:hypothetical protein [Actinomycetes bacterium]
MSECKLRAACGHHGIPCDEGGCVYWRVVEQLDLGVRESDGCAIQYFELLEGERGQQLAQWLLSVKERVESTADHAEPDPSGTDAPA